MLDAIDNSKENSLEKLLFGLGIPHVGEKTSKILAIHFKTLDNLISKDEEELTEISDIGETIAKSIKDYFMNKKNIEEIERLKRIGLNMNYLGSEIVENENFKDKSFVLTGTLESFSRDEAQEIIEGFGGKTVGSVSKKTSVVIVGKDPGSKYQKALDLSIEVWTEDEFKSKIEQ